jgi:hypothetical protein
MTHLPSVAPSSKTLIVDRDGLVSTDCARSLEDAVARLISDEYETIVVYGTAGREDAALVEYLAGTWPQFLRMITVKSVSPDAVRLWDDRIGLFVPERKKRSPRRDLAQREGESSPVLTRSRGARTPDLEDGGEQVEKRGRINRLPEETVDDGRIVVTAVSSLVHDQHDGENRSGPQRGDGVEPAALEHRVVENDDVEIAGAQEVHRFAGRGAGGELERVRRSLTPQQRVDQELIIVCDKNGAGHQGEGMQEPRKLGRSRAIRETTEKPSHFGRAHAAE